MISSQALGKHCSQNMKVKELSLELTTFCKYSRPGLSSFLKTPFALEERLKWSCPAGFLFLCKSESSSRGNPSPTQLRRSSSPLSSPSRSGSSSACRSGANVHDGRNIFEKIRSKTGRRIHCPFLSNFFVKRLSQVPLQQYLVPNFLQIAAVIKGLLTYSSPEGFIPTATALSTVHVFM